MCKNCETELNTLALRVLQLEKTVELQQNMLNNLSNKDNRLQDNTLGLFQVGHTIAL